MSRYFIVQSYESCIFSGNLHVKCNSSYVGLNNNSLLRFICLIPVDRTVWEGFRGVVLLEKERETIRGRRTLKGEEEGK